MNDTAIVKFLCDADAVLYIDGDNRGQLNKDIPLRIRLSKGTYSMKVIGNANESDNIKWTYSVAETGIEKLEEITLQPLIKQRMDAAAAAREKQIQQQNEFAEQKRKTDAVLKIVQNIEMVNLGRFAIDKYEVTQQLWVVVMYPNSAVISGCYDCPEERISWKKIQEFLRKLNAMTGKLYRLPTEAEWEWAAVGANKSHRFKFAGSNNIDEIAWYEKNSREKLHPVGQKQANEFGIYDMTGNVREWSIDANGEGVIKGGGYLDNANECRYWPRQFIPVGLSTEADERASYGIRPKDQQVGLRLAQSL